MRIDPNHLPASELPSDLNSQPINKEGVSSPISAGPEDRATFTSDSVSVHSLVTAALSTPDVRQATVDNLRKAVISGTYELNPSKIAESMVDDYA